MVLFSVRPGVSGALSNVGCEGCECVDPVETPGMLAIWQKLHSSGWRFVQLDHICVSLCVKALIGHFETSCVHIQNLPPARNWV